MFVANAAVAGVRKGVVGSRKKQSWSIPRECELSVRSTEVGFDSVLRLRYTAGKEWRSYMKCVKGDASSERAIAIFTTNTSIAQRVLGFDIVGSRFMPRVPPETEVTIAELQ